MMWLWSGSTVFVPVFMTVAWGGSLEVSMLRLWSALMCRHTWRWYPVGTIYYYVSIFITLKTSYIRVMTCYVTWFLTLETVILFMRHNIHCWGWYQCGCKLLYGLELLNFRYSICQSLWLLLVDWSGYAMGILSPLTNILMVTALFVKLHLLVSLLKQCMYVFLFLLLYLNKTGYGSVNIGGTYF